ncbi:hypothetical protein D9611_005648 [Ephemerocybe angulata]|uniref:Arrestin C-terminal-like domain-containing protein n=1 Tax=Ephemerocybe angulata TaxID=980116 RepID=A0A8H5BI07_9AGAR|nr:hypothetical protein D9611_005648 [Tulosesus angulatus]
MVADGRLRLIGFECIAPVKERSIFYEYVVPLSSVARDLGDLYLSGADEEGFMLVNEGQFLFPFSFEISSTADYGAPKGSFTPHSGVALRSIRIKDPISEGKSVAHFYRDIHVWPRLETSEALSPLSRPIQVTMSDFDGALKFTVILHRLTWIAGQPCFLKFLVVNKTVKTVRSLAIELHRDTVVYKPQPGSNGTDDDSNFEAFTVSKLISAVSLPMGDRAERGYAGARGWWTGVLPGESLQFSHSIALPVDALSVSKGRLLEVAYRLRAAISLGNLLPTELSADVPIRIINFISLDPPPSQPNVPPAISTQASSQSSQERSGKRPISFLSSTGPKHALAMHQEDRDIVQEVVVTAPVPKMQSENSAGHFADLYYNSIQEHPEGYLGSESSGDIAARPTSNDHLPEMRTLPTKSSCYSQMSLQRNTNVDREHEGGALPHSELAIPAPVVMEVSQSSGQGTQTVYFSSLLSQRPSRVGSPPSIKKHTSRKLPRPPLTPTNEGAMANPGPPSTPPRRSTGSEAAFPGLSPLSPGAVSVKDKIRELEERVKAIEAGSNL